MEDRLKSANTMKEIRNLAKNVLGLHEAIKTAVLPVKKLTKNVFQRFRLEEKPFSIFMVTNGDDIDTLWEEIHKVDPSLTQGDTTQVKLR